MSLSLKGISNVLIGSSNNNSNNLNGLNGLNGNSNSNNNSPSTSFIKTNTNINTNNNTITSTSPTTPTNNYQSKSKILTVSSLLSTSPINNQHLVNGVSEPKEGEEEDILTQTKNLENHHHNHQNTPANGSTLNINTTSTSTISNNNSPVKIPKLQLLRRDSSNLNIVKQWINDTVKATLTDSVSLSSSTISNTSSSSLASSSTTSETVGGDKNLENIVKLDIGGKYFSAALSTLTRYPETMLGVMFSGRYDLPKDKEGRIFIDRDGKLFTHVLSYLRDGPLWTPPLDLDLRRRIEIELSYFGLPGFSNVIGASPANTPRCVCGIKYQTLGQDTNHQGLWEEVKNMSSTIKSFRLLVSMNNTLYAITERVHANNNEISTFQFEQYNNRFNTWSFLCPILDTMASYYLATAVVGDCIYAIPDAGLHQPMFQYDRKENKWRSTETQLPTGKTSFSLAVLDEYIYVIGGYKGSTPSDLVERYHPKSNSWCSVTPMSSKRAECSAVVIDGNIYVIGGSSPNTTVERFNPHTNGWSYVCNLSARHFIISAATTLDNKIYAIGAENECDGQNIVLQYNPLTNVWKRVAPLLYNTYNTYSAIVLDHYIYLIPWNGSGSNSVNRYEPCTVENL
eukprot:gene3079-3850_t